MGSITASWMCSSAGVFRECGPFQIRLCCFASLSAYANLGWIVFAGVAIYIFTSTLFASWGREVCVFQSIALSQLICIHALSLGLWVRAASLAPAVIIFRHANTSIMPFRRNARAANAGGAGKLVRSRTDTVIYVGFDQSWKVAARHWMRFPQRALDEIRDRPQNVFTPTQRWQLKLTSRAHEYY